MLWFGICCHPGADCEVFGLLGLGIQVFYYSKRPNLFCTRLLDSERTDDCIYLKKLYFGAFCDIYK